LGGKEGTAMMGRAEIVDILICEGVCEAVAWHIAMEMRPEYLATLNQDIVRETVDNIIWEHLERTGELEEDYATPV
jgi:hypothetical protein